MEFKYPSLNINGIYFGDLLFSKNITIEELLPHLDAFNQDVYGTIDSLVKSGKFSNGHITVSDRLRFYDENNKMLFVADVSLPKSAIVVGTVRNGQFIFGLG